MVVEEVMITLSGGAPWGFRLQGGAEQKKPLQVAKVRKRSKACRAGLREGDELVSINEETCAGLSHAQAMNLIDSSPGTLLIRVKRAPVGFQSVVLLTRAPSPRIDKEYRATLRAMSPKSPQTTAREGHGSTDATAGQLGNPTGVARREVIYHPPPGGWSSQTETSAENSSVSTDDQNPREGATEVDSGFQEPSSLPPLVSPERARGALQLASRKQLVPMVGPVENPVDEELTVTYMDKAKQAKLHRGDTVQDKQVKEARTKCRTIASLLTDAPNPHSKGVLMFKKRRQRSKKYTLTSFGSVEEDALQDSHEDDGLLPGSESEFDEDGFAAVPDPTWDSDYLEVLEKRSAAVQPPAESENGEGPGLTATSGKGARLFEQQRKRVVEHMRKMAAQKQQHPALPEPRAQPCPEKPPLSQPLLQESHIPPPVPPPSLSIPNVEPVVLSTASVVMSLPPVRSQPAEPHPALLPRPVSSQLPVLPPSSVVNRTARPFAPGFISHRAATAPVVFRPHVTKKTKPAMAAEVMQTSFCAASTEAKPSISIASSEMSGQEDPVSGSPSVLSPPFSPPLTPAPTHSPGTPSSGANQQPPPLVSSTVWEVVPSAPPAPLPSSGSSTVAPVSHEQRTSAPQARTGILQEALRRGSKKPMFSIYEDKKGATPNPELLSLVQDLDEKPKVGLWSSHEEDIFNQETEACNFLQGQKPKVPPPVAPKPRVIPETPHIPPMEGKGAELFARRQSRMDRYVVDSSGEQSAEPPSPVRLHQLSPTPSLPAHWKYSPNIRAPPPISYNPLLSPSCPPGAQRSRVSETQRGAQKGGLHKEGIPALDFIRRQPYQLNPAMFTGTSGQSKVNQSQMQHQSSYMMGSSLIPPRQVPVKYGRVHEIRRFSTPTPMSAPTSLVPTVIAPRAATTLGDPLLRSDATSPTPAQQRPPTIRSPPPGPTAALPELPRISSAPVPSRVHASGPVPFPGPAYTGLHVSKLFQSAPELSPLPPSPQRSAALQAPKPRFVASRRGVHASVWRPGYMQP
ncbi:synaptopodin 2-like protein isoform X2 [Scleropages formosus]|uniref:Synaptopodin 2-like protein n=1 Tax=Scleropages formosus TaxID=113540 RepID=A0A8C9VB00_SCLFO|nr:synaptopodin 2-like protein isoform X2 [Scleropages formosus]